ncbi:hypothetical protein [Arthrobacter sp. ZGTC412]|uniref:hypothetical protein n=1 Tax=Arthrobacter sp. ZGTC412 TaxID=2058900 RepID=UPI0027D2EE39|nr:hypothetical protein [Arthrobacter sp. ZGTC412]
MARAGAGADGVSDDVPDADDVPGADGVPDAAGGADGASGLAELAPGAVAVVPCDCAALGPHPLSISAAAAAAVVITNPCEIR